MDQIEFYGPAVREVDLGDPTTDRLLTIRVHPDDDPHSREARRAVRSAALGWSAPWIIVTGEPARALTHDDVATWPPQHWLVACHGARDRALDERGPAAPSPPPLLDGSDTEGDRPFR